MSQNLPIVEKKMEEEKKTPQQSESVLSVLVNRLGWISVRGTFYPPDDPYLNGRFQWKIELPKGFKKILLDDQNSMKEGRLVKIPAQYSIEKMLDKYLESQKIDRNGPKTGDQQLVQHRIEVLIEFFTNSLRTKVLCEAEQRQYKELRKGKKGFRPSDHYGLIHLVRFVDMLPNAVEFLAYEERHLKNITPVAEAFLKWCNNKRHGFYDKSRDFIQ